MGARARAEAFLESRKSAPDELANDMFPEVPSEVFGGDWETLHQTRLHDYEGMHLKEMRGLLAGVRRKLENKSQWSLKHLAIIDNLGVALAQSKGRCHSIALLNLMRRLGALLLATGAVLCCRWVPSESNAADEPSRKWDPAGNKKKSEGGANEYDHHSFVYDPGGDLRDDLGKEGTFADTAFCATVAEEAERTAAPAEHKAEKGSEGGDGGGHREVSSERCLDRRGEWTSDIGCR